MRGARFPQMVVQHHNMFDYFFQVNCCSITVYYHLFHRMMNTMYRVSHVYKVDYDVCFGIVRCLVQTQTMIKKKDPFSAILTSWVLYCSRQRLDLMRQLSLSLYHLFSLMLMCGPEPVSILMHSINLIWVEQSYQYWHVVDFHHQYRLLEEKTSVWIESRKKMQSTIDLTIAMTKSSDFVLQ